MDEFDSIFKGENADFLSIFQIFSNPIKNISLIGTSNTMEIMNTLMTKYKLSLPDIKNIVFKPYSSD